MNTISTNTANTDSGRNLLVIKASAGSGKTFQLAQQYIKRLLFEHDPDTGQLVSRREPDFTGTLNAHRLLLAITFTNKATDEMKERIVKQLHALASNQDSPYLDGYIKETGLKNDEIRDLARLALNELLFDYSNFNVSTIDSFFQGILRNFARELDRDFNYDIQLDEKYAVKVAIHNFMLSLGQSGTTTEADKWVLKIMRNLLDDPTKSKWNFFKDSGDLHKIAEKMNSEVFRRHMDATRDYLGKKNSDGSYSSDFTKIEQFRQWLQQAAKRCEQMAHDDLKAYLAPMESRLNYTLKKRCTATEFNALSPEVRKNFEKQGKDFITRQFKTGKLHKAPTEQELQEIYDKLSRYIALSDAAQLFRQIEKRLGVLGLLGEIDRYLEQFRHENNAILIGDTNDLIATVLKSGAPFVYERVGTAINHFMIDEFQDTSAKQYENFKALIEESLSNHHFNMLIGDAKQSIYRFRNADVTVFRELVGRNFKDYIINAEEADPNKPTSTNFRSCHHIIDFNNSLFGHVMSEYKGNNTVKDTYSDYLQGEPHDIDKKLPGYVRLYTNNYKMLATQDPFIAPIVEKDSNPQEPLQEGEQHQDQEDKSETDILTLLPAYLLKLRQRYEWRQIGILVNTNTEGKMIVERILDHNRKAPDQPISIVSGEALLLANSPIVRRIIATLRFIDITQPGMPEDADDTGQDGNVNPQALNGLKKRRRSDQRLYTSLSRFLQQLSEHGEDDPKLNGQMLITSLVADNEAMNQEFANELSSLLPADGEVSTLVSIVENIIRHFMPNDNGQGDMDKETSFLLAFQDTVMQFCAKRNGGSVREFLRYWDDNKERLTINSNSNANAINIMTIHKAKGLEFDCVVIPFANWQLNDNKKEEELWMTRETFADMANSLEIPLKDKDLLPPLVPIHKKEIALVNKWGLLTGKAKEFFDKNQNDILIDNLNKTYVALTRPRIEMHIFCGKDSDTNDIKKLLEGYAQNSGLMKPIGGSPDKGWYQKGEESTHEEIKSSKKNDKNEAEVKSTPLDHYTVNDVPPQVLVRIDNDSSASRKHAGRRLHSLLSQIIDRDDLERVISQGIKHGIITDDPDDPCSLNNVERHIVKPIQGQNSTIAAWFDPKNVIYSERTITANTNLLQRVKSKKIRRPDGTIVAIENLRPDRIVRRPDGTVIVIDYKSGKRNDKKYAAQVKQYIEKLREVFPESRFMGYVWYTTLDEAVKVNVD